MRLSFGEGLAIIHPMIYEGALILGGVVLGGLAMAAWASRRVQKAQQNISEELARYRRSQMFGNIGVWDWSIKNDALYWSDEIYGMFGHEPGAVTPTYQFFIDSVHPDDKARVQAAEDACLANLSAHDIVYRVVWSDGTIKWLHETGDVLFDERGEAVRFTGILRDVTASKLQQDEILHLAHYDGLTGLANRELFRTRLEDAMRRADRHKTMVALVFLDLNRFKPVNDTYGHAAGDKLLAAVAKKLTKAVRRADSVARYGGDEFVVVLEDLKTAEEAHWVVDKLRAVFKDDFIIDGRRLSIGVSTGISLYPQDAQDADKLIHIADMAMYEEKTGEADSASALR